MPFREGDITKMQALQRTWSYPTAMTIVVALVLAVVGSMAVGGGKEKYSTASLSTTESRSVGAFVRDVDVSEVYPNEFTNTVKGAWIERIYQRYEYIPINKRVAGMRVCILCDNSNGELSGCYCEFQASRGVNEVGGGTVFSGSIAVFFLDIYSLDEFPSGVASVQKQRDSSVARFNIRNPKNDGEQN